MKATGIVRRVDELGRVVLPIELRNLLSIKVRDSLEIYTEDDMIILKKYEPACIFNQTMEELVTYKGRNVSKTAIIEMAVMAGLIEE